MHNIDFVSQPMTNCFSFKPLKQGSRVSAGPGTNLLAPVDFTYSGSLLRTCCCRILGPLRVHRRAIIGRQNKTAMGRKDKSQEIRKS